MTQATNAEWHGARLERIKEYAYRRHEYLVLDWMSTLSNLLRVEER